MINQIAYSSLRVSAVCFTQPLDLVKNRMQLSGKDFSCLQTKQMLIAVHPRTGEGGTAREYKTSVHAFFKILRTEGVVGIYNGYVL